MPKSLYNSLFPSGIVLVFTIVKPNVYVQKLPFDRAAER